MAADPAPFLQDLRALLEEHAPSGPREILSIRDFRAFLDRAEERGESVRDRRGFRPGHLTGSALPWSGKTRQVCLVRHPRLLRWLQPGGHVEEGDGRILDTALREMREETGLEALPHDPPRFLGVDVHTIPAASGEPAHRHFDVLFLVPCTKTSLKPSKGTLEAEWFDLEGPFPGSGDTALGTRLESLRNLAGTIESRTTP